MTTADHILRNTQAILTVTFTAGDADGNVTVTITKADGTVLVATTNATNDPAAGVYTYTLAPQTTLEQLTVVWAGSWGGVAQSITTYAEIVGGHLFTLAQIRAFDTALASTVSYPDAVLREARAGIADFFEDECGVSFFPRFRRETVDGDGRYDVWLPRGRVRSVRSSSVAGTALTVDELADVKVYSYGRLYRAAGWTSGNRNVVVEYEHGHDVPPWDIHRAALTLAQYTLRPSDLTTQRAILVQNELGTLRLQTPGAKYPTGIPSVDAALDKHSEKSLVA